jgi:hypothetical protein
MADEVKKVALTINGNELEPPSIIKCKRAIEKIDEYNHLKSYTIYNYAPSITNGTLEKVNCHFREKEVFEAFCANGYRKRFAMQVGEFLCPTSRRDDNSDVQLREGIRALLPFVSFCSTFTLRVKGERYVLNGEEKEYTTDWYQRTSLDFAWGEHFSAFKSGDVKHFINVDTCEEFEATEF